MKNRITEWLRKFLIKTILPLKKKKDNFLSKFRFSIVFRISLNYLKSMIFYGILFFFLFTILFLGIETNHLINNSRQIIKRIKNNTVILPYNPGADGQSSYLPEVNPYKFNGISMKIKNMDTNSIIYNDISLDLSKKKHYFGHIYYNKKIKKNSLVFLHKENYMYRNNLYEAYFQFDLTKNSMDVKNLLPGMVILYLFIVLLIINSGRKGDAKLFSSIKAMSSTANRLTINNLHSERLNIDGTKSELKDLAATINHMLDRLETSYESQKQFVSDASHELRTPIAVIQGYANLLKRWGTKNPEVLLESIDAIQSEAKEMQDLVEKLLFLSRHDKKTLRLKKAKFNMCEAVSEMVKETKMVVNNRNIQSSVMENVIVYGDKQALKQVVRVFIDNAVKYTKDGDSIEITCENNQGNCYVTVADSGIGMTKNDLDHIFERFYRSEHVRNEKISGHGLGLSIAKLIVLKHTGSIKVRSQYKKGSSFTIILPKKDYY